MFVCVLMGHSFYGAAMDMSNIPPFDDHSHESDDQSSGYLEDALFKLSSKRRRMLLFHDHRYWNSNSPQEYDNHCKGFPKFQTENNGLLMTERHLNKLSTEPTNTLKQTVISPHTSFSHGGNEEETKKHTTRVVYPFALVKPGGFKGDVSLNDINRRIRMAPTRSLKHPVGKFACRSVVSPNGPGLSGKAVVSLTRIHTQGRGTITIIRTKT